MQKISVIVPVYNKEAYIERCLNSIIKQTYTNTEIIIVNDGSTDNSQSVINKYKESYPKLIKTYEKKNCGVASARNYGIEKVTGDYFLFVDADDYIDLDLIQKLIDILKYQEIDIIKYKTRIIKNDTEELNDGPVFEVADGQDAFNKLCFADKLIDTPCLYLFNTKFFKDNNFSFASNMYHEDFGLIPLVIIKANTFVSSNICGYNYIQVDDSIIRNDDYEKTLKKANDLLYHYDNMIKEISNAEISKKTKDNIKIYYTNAILNRVNELNEEDKKEYIDKIKNRALISNLKIKSIKGLIKKIYYRILFK